MDRDTQIRLARRILQAARDPEGELAGEARANPVAEYVDPEFLTQEQRTLFRREAIPVGLSGDVGEPGSFLASEVADIPLLLTRDHERRLHAFLNVCRHRGAPVASGQGVNTNRLICPYHGWAYGLDGALLACSHPRAFAAMDPKNHSLTSLAVVETHGLIYVCPTPGLPIDVARVLDGVETELAPYGLESYHPLESRRLERSLNWKLVVDTFLEAYHVPYLHGESLAPMFAGERAVFDAFGCNGRLAVVRRSFDQIERLPESEWSVLPHLTVLYYLFPNTILIHQQDHIQLVQGFPLDGSPDRSRITMSIYTPEPVQSEEARRHWERNVEILVKATDEDFRLGEKIQQGFHSGAQTHILFGRNEPGLAHFHRVIREHLGSDNHRDTKDTEKNG